MHKLPAIGSLFARVYATNAMHACFIVEIDPTARKMQPFTGY